MTSLVFEVAFGVDAASEPASQDWTELSGRVRRLWLTSGRSRLGGAPSQARLSLDNRDRQLDPTSPTAVPGLVPMRHARLSVVTGGQTVPVFRGFVESWPLTWPDKVDVLSEVTLVDAFAWLSTVDADVSFGRERSHQRVDAILDLAGWPAARRSVSDGVVLLDEFEQTSANLFRLLQDCAEAEDGEFHVDADGSVAFASRHARFDAAVDETFGPAGVGVFHAEPQFDSSWLSNVARVELSNGDVWEAIEDSSVDAYGVRVAPLRDLPLPKHEAQGRAAWEVWRFSEPSVWVDSLTVRNPTDAQLASILSLDVGALVEVVRPFKDGSTFEFAGHVERVQVDAVPKVWEVTFDLSPHFGAGPWWEWYSDAAVEGDGWVSETATEGPRWAP